MAKTQAPRQAGAATRRSDSLAETTHSPTGGLKVLEGGWQGVNVSAGAASAHTFTRPVAPHARTVDTTVANFIRMKCDYRKTHSPTSSVRDKPACPRTGKMRQDERQLRNTFRKRERGAEYDREEEEERRRPCKPRRRQGTAVNGYRRPRRCLCTTYAAQHTEARRRPPPDAVYTRGNPSRTVHAGSARPPRPPDESSSGH
jgi:hypothetical protein